MKEKQIKAKQRFTKILSVSLLVIRCLASRLAPRLGFSIINYKTTPPQSSSSPSSSFRPPALGLSPSIRYCISACECRRLNDSLFSCICICAQNIETSWHFSCPLSPGPLWDADKGRNKLSHRSTFQCWSRKEGQRGKVFQKGGKDGDIKGEKSKWLKVEECMWVSVAFVCRGRCLWLYVHSLAPSDCYFSRWLLICVLITLTYYNAAWPSLPYGLSSRPLHEHE